MNEQTERGKTKWDAGSLCNDECGPGALWEFWQVLCC